MSKWFHTLCHVSFPFRCRFVFVSSQTFCHFVIFPLIGENVLSALPHNRNDDTTPRPRYEAGSAYIMQPCIRANARAVYRSLALNIRDIRFQTVRALTVRACPFRASATSRGNFTLTIVATRDGQPFTVRYALQKPPPRARHVVFARDGAGTSPPISASTLRILGSTDLGSTAIKCHFGFKNKKDHLSNPSYRRRALM